MKILWLLPLQLLAEVVLDTPDNAVKFIHQEHVYDHKLKQQKLRQMIVRQTHTDEKIFRNRRQYEKQRNLPTYYMNNLRRLQREIYNLNKWRASNAAQEQKIKDYDGVIDQLKKQVADQNDLLTKMVYGSRRHKRRNHRKKTRGRRSVNNDDRLDGLERLIESVLNEKANLLGTMNRMELRISELELSLQESNEQYNRVMMETVQLTENEARLNETIESLESKLNSPLVPEDSSYSSLTSSDVPVYEDPVYEADDRTEALESEIQSLHDRLFRMEIALNETSDIVIEKNVQLDQQEGEMRILHDKLNEMQNIVIQKNTKLDVLAEQVLVNTERNRLTAANRDDLDRLNHQLKGQSFELLNDTVSETTVVHEVHSHELAHIDEKLDENEESLIRMNSTLEHTVGKIDDIAIHLTGLANSLDRFSNLYKKMEGELNLFKINATASMTSFDRTVDLSIDLLDRMGQFNEDIVDRVAKLEETFVPNFLAYNQTDYLLDDYFETELEANDYGYVDPLVAGDL